MEEARTDVPEGMEEHGRGMYCQRDVENALNATKHPTYVLDREQVGTVDGTDRARRL